MAELPKFDNYKEEVAQLILSEGNNLKGLPEYLGILILELGPGTLKAELSVRNELLTPFGNMHGGVLAGFIDHVLGVVVYPLIDIGQWAATTEFKLNYLAPISKGKMIAEAEVISLTRSTAVVRVFVSNEGRLCCSAQGTILIRDPKNK